MEDAVVSQRLNALLAGGRIEGVLCIPILAIAYSARVNGTPLGSLYEDPKKCIEAQLLAAEMHGYEPLPIYGYAAFGAWEFGGKVELPYEKGLSPWVAETPVKEPDDVERLEVPDPKTAGSMPMTIEAAREAVRLKYPALFPAGGVFTWACNIIGYERVMRWLIREPDLVHKVLRKAADFSIAIAEYFVSEFGGDACIAVDLSPSEANTLISPKHFEEFALPYTREVHERILGMGVPRFLTHICGEQNKNLPHWKKIPYGKPGILSFGHQVDLEVASKIFGEDNIIMGNVDTISLSQKPFNEVFETCKTCAEKGRKNPAGYILSPACEIPPNTPPVNVYAMVKAAREC